jgi:thioredoxin reductase (NADPH)
MSSLKNGKRSPLLKKSKAWDYETAVIGGGPGGLISILYLKRFRRSAILVQSGKPRAEWIPKTHNVLGFPRGISGKNLLERLRKQVSSVGARIIKSEAKISRIKGGFRVFTKKGKFTARTVILATGIQDIDPPIRNLLSLRQKGLLRYCPICDAFEFSEAELVVLAQDSDGFSRALFLRRYARRLSIVAPPGAKIKKEKLQLAKKMAAAVYFEHINRITPARKPKKGVTVFLQSGKKISCRVVYVELGSRTCDSAFRNLKLRKDKKGRILTDEDQRTSIPELFAVGDCTHQVSQINVAAGQAAIAATTIHNYFRAL